MSKSMLEELFAEQIRTSKVAGLPWQQDYRFHPERKWRFDFAFPSQTHLEGERHHVAFAVEIEGGSWVSGRHSRGAGFEADCEKYNAAVLAGWRVLRFTSKMVEDGRAIAFLERALG